MKNLLWPIVPYSGLRGVDDFGSGAFGADRVTSEHSAGTAPAGTAYGHMGVDIAAEVGDELVAPADGMLFGSGFAYAGAGGGLRSIHLTLKAGAAERPTRLVILYAKPVIATPRTEVKAGQKIGIVQNVAAFHMAGQRAKRMTNHVHVAAYALGDDLKTWKLVDPTPLFKVA